MRDKRLETTPFGVTTGLSQQARQITRSMQNPNNPHFLARIEEENQIAPMSGRAQPHMHIIAGRETFRTVSGL